jgi:hypothetical protein
MIWIPYIFFSAKGEDTDGMALQILPCAVDTVSARLALDRTGDLRCRVEYQRYPRLKNKYFEWGKQVLVLQMRAKGGQEGRTKENG